MIDDICKHIDRTYAKVFQQGKALMPVHRVQRGAWTPLGRFCV